MHGPIDCFTQQTDTDMLRGVLKKTSLLSKSRTVYKCKGLDAKTVTIMHCTQRQERYPSHISNPVECGQHCTSHGACFQNDVAYYFRSVLTSLGGYARKVQSMC